ncbi:Shedu anti-phage system protein SduA domain-containing protein [Amycolatopsis sp. NPDC051071]|uniref:Shedu anti-phage system protein SduA domain-containing protein n=1 Tax=Amycolatopsis sp. NPDC051071 TaxID=3154637 RepID=UPI0034128500
MSSHPAESAVQRFWDAHSGSVEPDRNGAIRHGQIVQAIIDIVVDELVRCGIDRASIHLDQPLPLPGAYHESSTPWDLVVIEDGMPVAAIEVTTGVGPSVRRNMQNRMNEILASATNVSRGYDQPSVRALKPALAQLFLLEDLPELTKPRRQRTTALSLTESPDVPTSREDQLRDFLKRLVHDGLYDAICFIVSQAPPTMTIREPDPEIGFATFAKNIVERITEIREARRRRNIDATELGRLLAARNVSATELGRALGGLVELDDVVSGLSSTESGRLAVDVDVIRRRRKAVAELRELVLDPATTEAAIQKRIGRKYWIFGGHYTGVLERRDGFALDQHDIPLVCADRSIHIVELKRPGDKLVKKHRNHLIVSTEVHEAVAQCMNYLRTIDELGASMQTLHHNELSLNYDYRRAKGTVVIGHPDLAATAAATREQIEQTIRSYNAHLTRVQVVTFAELVDSAELALKFEEEEQGDS